MSTVRQRKISFATVEEKEPASTIIGETDEDTENEVVERRKRRELSAGKWAKAPPQKWFANRVDVLRGFGLRYSAVELLLHGWIIALGVYMFFLLWGAGSLKDEAIKILTAFTSAIFDFLYGVQGSAAAFFLMGLLVWLGTVLYMRRPVDVLLIDFKTYRHKVMGGDPRNTHGYGVSYERFMQESKAALHTDGSKCFNEKALEFQEKILYSSCISEQALFPESILKEEVGQDGKDAELKSLNMKGAREEAEQMMFNAVEQVLEATKTKPSDVGILIVNCSLFCPTPSLSAMIVNKFKFRSDVISYNLGGMGCSASPISIDLAKRLLTSPHQRDTLALVVSTENITQNWYRGSDRGMLLSNTLFRCGAAAILLSNRSCDRSRARFKLLHTVRTHTGQSDDCYRAVFQEEDEEGIRGVRLQKQIMQVAGDSLKVNISTLGPLVLPISEQLRYLANMVARRAIRGQLPLPGPIRKAVQSIACSVVQMKAVQGFVGFKEPKKAKDNSVATPGCKPLYEAAKTPRGTSLQVALKKQLPPYVPNFTKAFEWICVHTGGRAVIDAIENNLELPAYYLEPSRLSLYKFGNVSSASIWYELEIVSELGNTCGTERPGGIQPPTPRRLQTGDKVWQIAFGSGFKCNSAVWMTLKDH